ncbi:squalene/phytoene synthase family protein [Lentibacillus saliphilus]|uniref:squalene/phytoene synthase family protein n=1 Tax=Lentibacillus saliphilus TaxID=2737028 RepID=UPI001C30A444|nr:squalene/phytoene synthase family protein [Lentibacillus saliphilus]
MLKKDKTLQKEAMNMLKLTSRTFYIPITLLKPILKHTVGSAYLCMRAIDEIEDHEELPNDTKARLLLETSALLEEETFDTPRYKELLQPYESLLPEVTLRLGDWLDVCPDDIVGKVKDSTREMATGMAKWTLNDWDIRTKDDLDDYTYYVAGLVGVMLSDIWEWHDGTKTDRDLAIGYGRGLQAVNILRNQDEDFAERGVRFIPEGWGRDDVFAYAETNLQLADEYMKDIKTRNIMLFCKIPLALAKKTLQAMRNGREKMTRQEVEKTVDEIMEK